MKYIYVLASCSEISKEISFQHLEIEADSEAKAYNLGAKEAEKRKWIPVRKGTFGNDYVIER